MAYAAVSDVEIDVGDLPDDQVVKVEALLDRAEAQIRRVLSDLDDRIGDGRTDLTLVVQVESEMVASVLRNPQAVQSTTNTEGVGPFNRTRTFAVNLQAASGLLRLSAEHRALLGELPMVGPYVVPLSG